MTIEEVLAKLAQRECYLIVQPTQNGSEGVELVMARVRTDRDGKRRYNKVTVRDPAKTEQTLKGLLENDLSFRFPRME